MPMSKVDSRTERARAKILEVEQEMKKIGIWQNAPIAEAAMQFKEAFGADTMTFAQWLQFVLIRRVREIIESNGEFPARSQVGAYAVREFDGFDAASDLVLLLGEFDDLFCGE